LFTSAPVVLAAEALVRQIVVQYGEPNLAAEQIRARALSSHEDSLKEFSLACQQELQDIQRGT